MADMESAEIKQTQFGLWLKTEREARGLKGRQLAPIADTTHASISRYETGDRNPSKQMALRIASALASFETDESLRVRIINDGLNAAGYVKSDDSQGSTGAAVLTEPVENEIYYGLPEDIAPLVEGLNDLPGVEAREFAIEQMSNALDAVRRLVRNPNILAGDPLASGRYSEAQVRSARFVVRPVAPPPDEKGLYEDPESVIRPDEHGQPIVSERRGDSRKGTAPAGSLGENEAAEAHRVGEQAEEVSAGS